MGGKTAHRGASAADRPRCAAQAKISAGKSPAGCAAEKHDGRVERLAGRPAGHGCSRKRKPVCPSPPSGCRSTTFTRGRGEKPPASDRETPESLPSVMSACRVNCQGVAPFCSSFCSSFLQFAFLQSVCPQSPLCDNSLSTADTNLWWLFPVYVPQLLLR